MTADDPKSRRTVLRLAGSAAIAAALAGCGGGGGPGGNESGNESGNATANETGNETGNATANETGNESSNETANETGNQSANETGNQTEGSSGGGNAIEPGTEIMLGGETQGWQGQEPQQIAGQENPTLPLQEGESYDITWENLDGVGHNLQIVDDSDQVVDDYETEIMNQQGETQTLTVDEVTSEMAGYICEPHQGTMNGDIEVQ